MNVDTNGYIAYEYNSREVPDSLRSPASTSILPELPTIPNSIKQQPTVPSGTPGNSGTSANISSPAATIAEQNTSHYSTKNPSHHIHTDSNIRYSNHNHIQPIPVQPNNIQSLHTFTQANTNNSSESNNFGNNNNNSNRNPGYISNGNNNNNNANVINNSNHHNNRIRYDPQQPHLYPENYYTILGQRSPPNTYQNPSPLHTYNSEWIDTPQESPSRQQQYYDMSTIQSQLQQHHHQKHKVDTPSKQMNYSYITPISATKVSDITINEKHLDEDTSSVTSTEESQILAKTEYVHNVKVWDVLWDMINDVTGKDKFAKVSQYVLKLLLFHADKSQKYLSDDTFNIGHISARYNNKEKQLNLLRNFIRHPRDFLRTVVILFFSLFQSKLTGMVNGLSSYRQFLRFGKSPFRVRGLYNKLRENVSLKDANVKINYPTLFNRKTLGEIFGAYYSLADETSLLLKLNFYSSPTIKSLATRHEALAWYYDTWLNLYNAYEKSQLLAQQEIDIKIQIQVKNKAKILSKQLLGGHPLQINNKVSGKVSKEDSKLLSDIQFKKNNAYLDIYKNISDLVFNSYTVFDLKLPFDTLQIWMGISASTLSTIKIFRETRKRLIEEEIKKRK